MKTPKFWYLKKSTLSVLLYPLSLIWLLLAHLRNLVQTKREFNVPIICVGNLIAGGSGKTPLIIELCKILKKKNISVHVIYKAYKTNIYRKVIEVNNKLESEYIGDEPLLTSKYATTWVCKKRKEGIEKAIIEGAKLILLDDGLQDSSIKKTLNILVVNEIQGNGNSKIIPAGPLREKIPKSLNKSDCIFFYGSRLNFKKLFPYYKKRIFYGKIKSNINNLKIKKNARIVAFSGIAHPTNFFSLLIGNKLNLIKSFSFEDHYKYERKDLNRIVDFSKKTKSSTILTTSKDYVKIPNDLRKNVTEIKICIEFNKKIFYKFLDNKIGLNDKTYY